MLKNKNIMYSTQCIHVPAHLNFGQFILDAMWEHRDRVCLINGQTHGTMSYGELCQQAMNLAVSLARMGAQKGEVIAILSENRMEFFPTLVGAVCTGAIVTAINVSYSKGELKHVMGISKPKYIFCSPNAFKSHEKTLETFSFVKKIIVFGNEKLNNVLLYNELVVLLNNSEPELVTGQSQNEVTDFEKGMKNNTKETLNYSDYNAKVTNKKENVNYDDFQAKDVEGQTDTLMVLYSSGTTGLPKGVMITHLNVLTVCCLPSPQGSLTPLTIAPWYHIMGLVGGLLGLAKGRTVVYLPKFDVELYLKTIERYKVNQLLVVPPVLVAVSKSKLKYDVSSVTLIGSGAAPLLKDTVEGIKDRFPNAQVAQGYGLTESTLAILRDDVDQPQFIKPGGVGRVLLGCVKIVNPETNESLGPNRRGEVCIKGPLLMKGYVGRNPREDFDQDGYFRTGDIGYYDEDGVFFIVDRLKELIKYKGYQVPPAEIEALLLQHPSVKEAGVIGIEDKTAGEVPLAFVVRQPGCDVTEEEVQLFVAERLSSPKHLRGGVRFVDQIPKNPSGKILRKVLRSMVKNGKSKL